MKYQKFITFAFGIALLLSCSSKSDSSVSNVSESLTESKEAKAMLQGIWIDAETEEVSFRAVGDSIFYPDTVSQPTYFQIIGDSIVLETVGAKYPIVKQSPNVFWFKNQNGDVMKLNKSDDPIHSFAFVHERPKVMTYTSVVKTDSVVIYNGSRYHWYLAINPTKYKVNVSAYSSDGVEVDNTYYDNIIHVSLFSGSQKIFSSDIKKQMYASKIPVEFLNKAVLSDMDYTGVDAKGFHFVATICIPDGAACYKAENVISFDGKFQTELVEY